MYVDPSIDQTLHPGSLNSAELCALAGNPRTKEITVTSLQELLFENLTVFHAGDKPELMLLAAFDSLDAAQRCLTLLRDHTESVSEDLFSKAPSHLIIGEPASKHLFTIASADYYKGQFRLFLFNAQPEHVVLNLFESQQAAHEALEWLQCGMEQDKEEK